MYLVECYLMNAIKIKFVLYRVYWPKLIHWFTSTLTLCFYHHLRIFGITLVNSTQVRRWQQPHRDYIVNIMIQRKTSTDTVHSWEIMVRPFSMIIYIFLQAVICIYKESFFISFWEKNMLSKLIWRKNPRNIWVSIWIFYETHAWCMHKSLQ